MVYRNQNGMALIIAILVAFIILVLGSMALYISTQSTKISGEFSVYRSSVEAANGAFRETRAILSYIKENKPFSVPFNIIDNRTACLHYKLNTPSINWTNSDLTSNGCLARTVALAENTNDSKVIDYYDLKYSLGNYYVYLKIVNTSLGNTQTQNKGLTTGGTTSKKHGINIIFAPKAPYIYRIEIVSVSKLNPYDFSHVSVLYAF